MNQRNSTVLVVFFGVLLAGCDGIFGLDNFDPPDHELVGRVVFNGEPVGVRVPSNTAQIDLWQVEPAYELEGSIPVHLRMHGDYTAMLFRGTYDVQLRQDAGPWVHDPVRRPVTLSGPITTFDIPVRPYYTIDEGVLTYSPNPAPGGSITATFRVGQHVTTQALEYVGVYVNNTTFVDRQWQVVRLERNRAAILPQLNSNGTITITVNLPNTIHVTPSPDRRNRVYARLGVKTVGVSEMLFTRVYEIDI